MTKKFIKLECLPINIGVKEVHKAGIVAYLSKWGPKRGQMRANRGK